MLKIRILIKYESCAEIRESFLDEEWGSLETARENLKYIVEHYAIYRKSILLPTKEAVNEYLSSQADKKWLVNENHSSGGIDIYKAHHFIKISLDSGEYTKISAFWTGYFERLISVKAEISGEELELYV